MEVSGSGGTTRWEMVGDEKSSGRKAEGAVEPTMALSTDGEGGRRGGVRSTAPHTTLQQCHSREQPLSGAAEATCHCLTTVLTHWSLQWSALPATVLSCSPPMRCYRCWASRPRKDMEGGGVAHVSATLTQH